MDLWLFRFDDLTLGLDASSEHARTSPVDPRGSRRLVGYRGLGLSFPGPFTGKLGPDPVEFEAGEELTRAGRYLFGGHRARNGPLFPRIVVNKRTKSSEQEGGHDHGEANSPRLPCKGGA